MKRVHGFTFFDDCEISDYGDEASLFNCFSTKTNFTVRSHVEAYSSHDQIPITQLGKYCFHESRVKHLFFSPNSQIQEIRYSSFINSNIRTFVIPMSLKSLEMKANEKVRCIVPKFHKYIIESDDKCIYKKYPLQLIHFRFQPRRRHISFRKTIEIIGTRLMKKNEMIVSIHFPSSVIEIQESSFKKCPNLRYVTFSKDSKLKKICSTAFSWTNIRKIRIPASCEIIYSHAFSMCANLSDVIFEEPSNLMKIGEMAFRYTSIKHFEFPKSLKTVGQYAFQFSKLEEMIQKLMNLQ